MYHPVALVNIITVRGSDDSIAFSIVAKFFFLFLYTHINSRTAALRLAKFCMNV